MQWISCAEGIDKRLKVFEGVYVVRTAQTSYAYYMTMKRMSRVYWQPWMI